MKVDLSYDEILSSDRSKIERLAAAGELSEETLKRAGHLGRFLARVGTTVPDAIKETRVEDVLTETDLQKIWHETADPDLEPGDCPLIH
jgi:hypothetical protein